MKIVVFLLSAFFLISFQKPQQVKIVGFYSNEKSNDGEHSYGYFLRLWKYNNSIIGTVALNEGLIGDQSEQVINNVKFNDRTGDLSFTSSLNDEKIEFKGLVDKSKVQGTFKRTSRTDKNQLLKSCCNDAPTFRNYSTYKNWETDVLLND